MEGADIPTFGEALARFRTRAKLSQHKLADQLGKNRRTVAAWEAGEYLPKTKGDVLELARILKLNDEETTILLKAAGMDPSPSLWNVPHQRNPYFTGRDELFNQLDQRLAPTEQAISVETRRVALALTQPQAIKGLGGIGKTQVAVEYAYRSRDQGRYTHTFWVNAASEETIIVSFVAIAELLASFSAKSEVNKRKLVEVVKHRIEQCRERWLLIFDNADDVALVRDYLPQQGNGSILLTTRANAVGSLATSIEVETMSFVEGRQLLLHRAQRFEHASDEEINQAGSIVVALDHFPLALDQAGAYIEEIQCGFEEYLDLYQTHRQKLLAERGKPATDYPYSVATTWLLSFQKVQQASPAAAELLHLCAFLAPDRIPEELIKDGAAHWPSLLQQAATDPFAFHQMIKELLKFSLVKRLTEEHTLSIHRLVQAVLRDSMSAEIQQQWIQRVVHTVEAVFPESPDIANWPRLERLRPHALICAIWIEQSLLTTREAMLLLNQTGYYLKERVRYGEASPLYQRALAICEQLLGPIHPQTAQILNNLAELYRAEGKYEKVEPLLKRALVINEQRLGATHPDTALCLNNLAAFYVDQGKYADAEPLCQRALAICEQLLGPIHLRTATILNNLARLYAGQRKYADAEPLYQRALAICEQLLGSIHPLIAATLNNLARLYADQGKYADAEPLYQRALAIYEQLLGPIHPDTALGLNNLALLYYVQGKHVEAEPLLKRALSIYEQQLGFQHPTTQTIRANYTALLEAMKQDEATSS